MCNADMMYLGTQAQAYKSTKSHKFASCFPSSAPSLRLQPAQSRSSAAPTLSSPAQTMHLQRVLCPCLTKSPVSLFPLSSAGRPLTNYPEIRQDQHFLFLYRKSHQPFQGILEYMLRLFSIPSFFCKDIHYFSTWRLITSFSLQIFKVRR